MFDFDEFADINAFGNSFSSFPFCEPCFNPVAPLPVPIGVPEPIFIERILGCPVPVPDPVPFPVGIPEPVGIECPVGIPIPVGVPQPVPVSVPYEVRQKVIVVPQVRVFPAYIRLIEDQCCTPQNVAFQRRSSGGFRRRLGLDF